MAQEMFQKYFSGLQFLNFIGNVMFFFADVMSCTRRMFPVG